MSSVFTHRAPRVAKQVLSSPFVSCIFLRIISLRLLSLHVSKIVLHLRMLLLQCSLGLPNCLKVGQSIRFLLFLLELGLEVFCRDPVRIFFLLLRIYVLFGLLFHRLHVSLLFQTDFHEEFLLFSAIAEPLLVLLRAARGIDESLALGFFGLCPVSLFFDLFGEFVVDQRFLEFELLTLGICNLLLHTDLMSEVSLLEFLELADAEQFLLVPGKGLAHRLLVLVLLSVGGRSSVGVLHKPFGLAVADAKLDAPRR